MQKKVGVTLGWVLFVCGLFFFGRVALSFLAVDINFWQPIYPLRAFLSGFFSFCISCIVFSLSLDQQLKKILKRKLVKYLPFVLLFFSILAILSATALYQPEAGKHLVVLSLIGAVLTARLLVFIASKE